MRVTRGSYYILLKVSVWDNHLSALSHKFRTMLMNLKAFAVVEASSESVTTNSY